MNTSFQNENSSTDESENVISIIIIIVIMLFPILFRMSNVLWQTRRYRTILMYYHYFNIIFIEGIKSIYSRASCTIAIATLISCMFIRRHLLIFLLLTGTKLLSLTRVRTSPWGLTYTWRMVISNTCIFNY